MREIWGNIKGPENSKTSKTKDKVVRTQRMREPGCSKCHPKRAPNVDVVAPSKRVPTAPIISATVATRAIGLRIVPIEKTSAAVHGHPLEADANSLSIQSKNSRNDPYAMKIPQNRSGRNSDIAN